MLLGELFVFLINWYCCFATLLGEYLLDDIIVTVMCQINAFAMGMSGL